jgi:nucleoside-diphosphate-sugar epimerase
VEVRVARIFNTYGPRMLIDDGRVVSNFHCAGPPRGAAHHLWRWFPEPLVLLRE